MTIWPKKGCISPYFWLNKSDDAFFLDYEYPIHSGIWLGNNIHYFEQHNLKGKFRIDNISNISREKYEIMFHKRFD